jgi:Fic family protein
MARFWTRLANMPLSARQRKVVNKLLDAGPEGFEGGPSADKYQNLTSSSRQTASRDLSDLVDKGVLRVNGERKSTRYRIAVPEWL